jgi:hypothetical protein
MTRFPFINTRTALSALVCVLFFSVNCKQMSSPKQLHWDLSRSHNAADVKWDKDGDSMTLEDVIIELKLPHDRVFNGLAHKAICHRRGEKLESVALHLPKGTVDETYQTARRWADAFGFKTDGLDEWRAARNAKAMTPSETYRTILNDGAQSSVMLQILRSFDEEKPWFVSLEAEWAD